MNTTTTILLLLAMGCVFFNMERKKEALVLVSLVWGGMFILAAVLR
jgi:hypothetical protein